MTSPEATRPRVLHVITGLGTGGAEAMLVKLLEPLAGKVDSMVISLLGGGGNVPRIDALGIPLATLGMKRGGIPGVALVSRLCRLTSEFRPDVIQGWMYHGNVAAWLAAKCGRREARLLWNVRQTLYDIGREPRLTRWMIRVGAHLSGSVDGIVYNSRVSAGQHEAIGYAAARRVVIPNGFAVDVFAPQAAARASVRQEFGLPADALLIGQIARWHPMKGHGNLLKALARLSARGVDARLLLVGNGTSSENLELSDSLRGLGVGDRVILAGERTDMPRLMAALDVMVSASDWGEGFPNVLGEAMACGVPCVATDIGDSREVIGECGHIVPAGDPHALAAAIESLLCLPHDRRAALGARARARVCERFAMEHVSAEYLELYRGRSH